MTVDQSPDNSGGSRDTALMGLWTEKDFCNPACCRGFGFNIFDW
jgi:hypothetical protein